MQKARVWSCWNTHNTQNSSLDGVAFPQWACYRRCMMR